LKRQPQKRIALRLAIALATAGMASNLYAQGVDLAGRPLAEVRIEGLKQVPEQLVKNQVRLNKGDPYDARLVDSDIVRITHLGRFSAVRARVEPRPDGSLVLIYALTEPPLINDVQVVGNKELDDQDLLKAAILRAGDPVDPFLIDRGMTEIKKAYEKEGYFTTEVTVDKPLLDESGVLLYRVREGPRVRIRDVRFEGNGAFTGDQLASKIRSETYLFIFRKGELNREQLDSDVARIRDFYRERGYLDAQVGRRIDLAPEQRNAIVVFVVEEGKQYTVDQVKIEGNQLFGREQIIEAMPLKVGDVFAADRLKKTQEALDDLYGKLGFTDSRIAVERIFHENEPKVDLVVRVSEGLPHTVGQVTVRGNQLTQDKVILRQTRGMLPDRRYDRQGMQKTEQRLKESSLFSDAKITLLGNPDDEVRDALIEVKEQSTGSLSFGAGISSDAGVIGAIELTQRNFDVADWPDSAGEFFSGRAFRGAGQSFTLSLQPGDQTSRYSVSLREPYLLDSSLFLDTNLFFFTRERDVYNEERFGGSVGIGQRFGDVWSVAVRGRAEYVNIDNIEPQAPVDVFDVRGGSVITSIGPSIVRNTTDSRLFPTVGSNWEIGLSKALSPGDYDFWKFASDYRKFWTVDEDFFGRRTVLSIRNEIGYIFDAGFESADPGNPGHRDTAPVFERFYAGGHRSFRGFAYRGAGPTGIRHDTLPVERYGDQPVGGQWMFLLGAEYNFPVFQEVLRGVIFTDTGTVLSEVGFDSYRVAVGAGIRLKLPFFGQAPFALDFAIPLIKEELDDTRIFSFDVAIPFR
jgi:outer membrane protein insertion porin family